MNGRTLALYVLVGSLLITLVVLVIFLLPLGIGEGRRKVAAYQTRDNPPCKWVGDCFSFALATCESPDFIVDCRPNDWAARRVCVCGATGVSVGRELAWRDAGVSDASR